MGYDTNLTTPTNTDITNILLNTVADQSAIANNAAPVVTENYDFDAMLQQQALLQQQQEALLQQVYEQEMAKWQAQLELLQQQAAAMQAASVITTVDPALLDTNSISQQDLGAIALQNQAVTQDINQFVDMTSNMVPQVGVGNPIFIPSNVPQTGIIKNYTNYNYFYGKWTPGSAQRNLSEVWNASGRTSDRGIATLNNRYLVAVSPTFGKVGDNIDVCLDNGVVIPCTIADAKGSDAKSMWGHTFGKAVDVIEWESMGGQSIINTDGWQGSKVNCIINYSA